MGVRVCRRNGIGEGGFGTARKEFSGRDVHEVPWISCCRVSDSGVCLRARGLADVTGTRGNTDSPTGGEEEEEETEGGVDVEYVCCVCDKSVLCIIYTMRKQ